jgi:hypothetical protein
MNLSRYQNPSFTKVRSLNNILDIFAADIKEGDALPADYDAHGKALAEKQIVKGGYRLANMLKALKLDNWTAEEPEEKSWISSLLGI